MFFAEQEIGLQAPATARKDDAMNKFSNIRFARSGLILAAMVVTALACGPAAAQTKIKFSLDFKFEGPAAPFLVAIDKGYFKAEGLDVTIDSMASA